MPGPQRSPVEAAQNDVPTTQGQFDGLCSFAFNLGLRKVINSTLWRTRMAHD
ncbi:hypothetical protein BH09PSE3_BH09PSE3_23350 [soil metagenome]